VAETSWARDPVARLCEDIHICLDDWGEDPAYAEAAFKLRQVERELDVICASPGRREALRASGPAGGQEAHERYGVS
jgi:hypothetical protein